MSYVNYQNEKLSPFVRYIDDLMRYRHLCWNLVESDLRTRYRRSYLGILWAVIQPLGYSLVIAWAWGTIFGTKSYWEFAAYVYSGMLVWEYFANTVTTSLDSLVNATGYLRQSRVPFLIFQVRIPLTGLVNLMFGFIGLIVLLTVLQVWGPTLWPEQADTLPNLPSLGLHLLQLPIFVVFLVAFMTPLAIAASVLGAQLRDLKHATTLILQAMFFLSPVMLPRNHVKESLGILEIINPLVPLIDMFRNPLGLGQDDAPLVWEPQAIIVLSVWIAIIWAFALLVAYMAGRRVVFAL